MDMKRSRLSRRAVLTAGAAAGALLFMPRRSFAAATWQLHLAVPAPRAFGLLQALAPIIEKRLGETLEIVDFQTGGDDKWPLESVYAARPDSMNLLVAAAPHLVTMATYWRKDVDPSRLTKITKLTRGDSYAFIAPNDGATGLDGVKRLAKNGAMRVAVLDARSGHALFADLIGTKAGVKAEKIYVRSSDEALAAIAGGRADAAVAFSNIFAAAMAQHPRLRPLITSGAQRSPKFADVPTLWEATKDRKVDFTAAIAVFGPPGMPTTLVGRIDTALRAAEADPAAKQAATKFGYTLDPLGPQGLATDYARTVRAFKSVIPSNAAIRT